MKRENPSAVRSKKYLAEALIRIMHYKALDQITISELTEEAQLARRTFYKNFNTKEEVLKYKVRMLYMDYLSELKKFQVTSSYEIGVVYFSFFKKHEKDLQVLKRQDMLYVLSVYKEVLRERPELFEIFGLGEKYENALYQNAYRFGGAVYMLIEWISEDFSESPENMAKMLASLHSDIK